MLNPEMLRSLGRLTAAASELAILVVLGSLAGSWLDSQLTTSPVFLLVLAVAALVLGFVRLTRALRPDADPDAAADSPE
jgi:F0F1-type ATP synthase assembly protein I